MKIYFAGSIRGGRDDKELYKEIILLLKNYGEVLTEHIGDVNLSQLGELKKAEFIHDRDVEWIVGSDVIVAEVTTPSLGVGYELGIAEGLLKKVLCIYRRIPEKSLSAMILGNSKFQIEEYVNVKDLPIIFDTVFKK